MIDHYDKSVLYDMGHFSIKVEHTYIDEDFPMHTHDYSEAVILLAGTAEHRIGEQCYAIKPGDMFVIKGDIPHAYAGVSRLELLHLMYDSTIFEHYQNDLRIIQGFEALFLVEPEIRQRINYPYLLSLDKFERDQVTWMVHFIESQMRLAAAGYEIVVKMMFFSILSFLSAKYDAGYPHSRQLRLLAEVAGYMRQNLGQAITNQQLADCANVSVRHLNRLFQQYYQDSPMNYLLHLRLKAALDLLTKNCKSVTEIAQLCGFADSSYFSRVFREKYGISPKQARFLNHLDSSLN